MDFLHSLYTPEGLTRLITTGGYLLLFAVIFAETGLMLGFFLPGDSLLITAGVMAANPGYHLDIKVLIPLLCVAAILGNNTGYWFGRKTGPKLFARPNSRFFKRDRLLHTREFYETRGPIAIVLARFIPFARTFVPIVAGISEMPYKRFEIYDVGGGIAWITSMCTIGFTLGTRFPKIASSIDKVVIVVVTLSLMPMFFHWLSARLKAKAQRAAAHEADVASGTPLSAE